MNNISLLLLRLVFAGSMLYGHGLSKWKKLFEGVFFDGSLNFANPIGIGELPTLILAVFSEFLAPIFIIFGFKTRFFSFFPAATMFVAVFIVHLGDPFGKIEKALLFLCVFVILMMTGPGKYSIDKTNSITTATILFASSFILYYFLYYQGVSPIFCALFLFITAGWYISFARR
tara:strand:- start:2605 stop:3126 length:522 start_codon:yes stop_codon:yes gene_type:complete